MATFPYNKIKRLDLYLLHLLVFLVSFEERILSPVIGLFLLLNLFSHPWKERVMYFKRRKKYILAFISLYVLSWIGMLYTDDMQSGWFDLEVKMSLFLFPVIVLTSDVINKYTVYGLLRTYITGVVVASVFIFILAFVKYYYTGDPEVFYYKFFSHYHHPTYFAMYVNFAIASLLVLIFHFRDRPKVWHFVVLAFLMITTYQLASRTGLVVLILLIIYAFFYLLFPRLRLKRTLYALFAVILVTAAIVYPTKQYTRATKHIDKENKMSSFGIRIAMWEASRNIIVEHPVIGVGTGDVGRVLQKEFAEEKLIKAVRDNLNLHNQFLQTQVALGIFGTLALLVSLLLPFVVSIRKGRFFYPLFMLILIVNFMTESILRTQAGTVFYALLNVIVFFTYEE